MMKIRYRSNHIYCFIFIIIFLACFIPLELTSSFLEGVAGQEVFESDIFDENITIAPESIQTIDFNLQEGEEFEIIFSLQVKNNLPVDVWFVTEDHYLLLANGAQFLFFIDGSEQEVTYTKNIISLTEHDSYKLVITNNNNQTVEVNIVYEIRTYYTELEETSSSDSSIYLYPLLIAVVILIIITTILLFKTRSYKKAALKVKQKISPKKKTKKRKTKRAKNSVGNKENTMKTTTHKVKSIEPKVTKDESPKVIETLETEQNESEISDKVSPSFCGYCGKPIDTPYCMNCGRKV